MKVTLLVPTLNEISGMKEIMPRIKREWIDEILVLDGGSTDGTVEYAVSYGYRVVNQKSKGITKAIEEGIEASSGDVMIAFSPDGNSVPEFIPQLIEKMKEGYDMVIASRYLKGAKSEDDDAVTAFGNRMITATINILFGGHHTDSLVMFRAWKRSLEKHVPINVPRAGFEPYLAIRCAKRKLRYTEIPVSEPKRIGGVRKMNPLKNGLDILKLIIHEFFSKD